MHEMILLYLTSVHRRYVDICGISRKGIDDAKASRKTSYELECCGWGLRKQRERLEVRLISNITV